MKLADILSLKDYVRNWINRSPDTSVETFEKLWADSHMISARNFDEYLNGVRTRRRTFVIISICCFMWLASIGLAISLLFDGFWYWVGPKVGSLENRRPIYVILLLQFVYGAFIRTELIISERRQTLAFIPVFKQIQHHLNEDNVRSFSKRFLILTWLTSNVVMQIFFFSFVFTLISILPIIITGIDDFIRIMIFSTLFLVALYWLNQTTIPGALMLYLIADFFKTYFNQLNDDCKKFKCEINKIYKKRIDRVLARHSRMTVHVDKFNLFGRKIIAGFYVMAIIFIDLNLYLALFSQSAFWRMEFTNLSVSTFAIFAFLCFSMSSISTAAHRPLKLFHSMSASSKLSYKRKLRYLWFIERLTRPVIGIYCHDIAPFDNPRFYQLVVFCSSNFLLILSVLGF